VARQPSDQPTDGELEILQLLWSQGPSPLAAICEGLRRRRPVATTTVSTMLKLMAEKGQVKRSKETRGALWSARRSRRVTSRGLLHRFMDRAFGGSPSRMVAHLLEDGQLDDEERQQILRLLAEHGKDGDDEPAGRQQP
jgi:predicted transcriptional regulator